MAYALWLPDVLRDAGLVVRPFPDWQTRGGSTFSPRGVMLHHTVTAPTTADSVVDRMLAVTGSSTTPAPLANYSTNRDGSVSIIAAGTANHGGAGTWKGFSGNRHWLGDEMKNRGTSAEPWPARQLDAAYRAAAACLRHIGADASWLMGHKEYATPPGRKVDPHTLNMNTVRQIVAGIMEEDMPSLDEIRQLIRTELDLRDVTDYTGATTRQSGVVRDSVARLTYGRDDNRIFIGGMIQEARRDAQAARNQTTQSALRNAIGGLDSKAIADQVVAAVGAETAKAVADEIGRRLK